MVNSAIHRNGDDPRRIYIVSVFQRSVCVYNALSYSASEYREVIQQKSRFEQCYFCNFINTTRSVYE